MKKFDQSTKNDYIFLFKIRISSGRVQRSMNAPPFLLYTSLSSFLLCFCCVIVVRLNIVDGKTDPNYFILARKCKLIRQEQVL